MFEEPIDDSGADWNFESHQVFDTIPCEEDFFKTVGDYLDFEIIKNNPKIIAGMLLVL